MRVRRLVYLVALVVVITGLVACAAYAQGGPPGQPGAPALQPGAAPGGGQQGQDPQARRERMQRMARMMPMMQQQTPAIAVADGYVFVVYGNTLFQFTVDGLKQVAKASLTPDRPERAGGRRGGQRPMPGLPGGGPQQVAPPELPKP